jgi:hypothetical protein
MASDKPINKTSPGGVPPGLVRFGIAEIYPCGNAAH